MLLKLPRCFSSKSPHPRLGRFAGPCAGRPAGAGPRPRRGLLGGGPVEGPGPGETVVHVLR